MTSASRHLPIRSARTADLALPEFVAFNAGYDYPEMRKWELPFALSAARLGGVQSILDCTINPLDFGERILQLHSNVVYRHRPVIVEGEFRLPLGVPDRFFDRVFCLNTLEHLLAVQRRALLAEMAKKLRPGGLLVVTIDRYFEALFSVPEVVALEVAVPDRSEVFNGWNVLTPEEMIFSAGSVGLVPLGPLEPVSDDADPALYRRSAPYAHGSFGMVFAPEPGPLLERGKRIGLALLTWNTREISLESLRAHVVEARMLQRLGHEPCLIVCDNGSNDGTAAALRELDAQLEIPHRFIFNASNRGSSIARNQIVEAFRAAGGDYLIFVDGDIELVPHSTYAMMRHMEDAGHLLGCLGASSYHHTPNRAYATPSLFAIAPRNVETTNLVAWTQYGIFRREIFEAGVRFDEAGPFDRAGWGFEDNDLAFQMNVAGYANQYFHGIRYLHRHPNSSVAVMRSLGVDPREAYAKRKAYVLEKWRNTPGINDGPLSFVRDVQIVI